jgi:hypothetical protein
MPLLQDEELDRLTVSFDKGSITFKMRPTALTVDTARRMSNETRRAGLVESRMKRLEERVKTDNLDATEFDRVLKELKSLEANPDQLSLIAEFIMICSEGWEDYYRNAEDERNNKLIPFTKEYIEKINPVKLNMIMEAFNGYFGFQADEVKKLSGNSPSTSLIQAQE